MRINSSASVSIHACTSFLVATIFTSVLLPAQAQAGVDQSQCPDVQGRFQQKNRAEPLVISMGKQHGLLFYIIDGSRFFVSGQDHMAADGKTTYLATCEDGRMTLNLSVAGRNKKISLSTFAGNGSALYETREDQPTDEQVLYDIDRIEKLPAHDISNCPKIRAMDHTSSRRPISRRDEPLAVSVSTRSNGINLQVEETFIVNGQKQSMGGGVSYQGVCAGGGAYLNFYDGSKFIGSSIYLFLGATDRITVLNFDVRKNHGFSTDYYDPIKYMTEETTTSSDDEDDEDDE